jgi:sugar transferase (PEP-CTERM/EpsH1 system associated)
MEPLLFLCHRLPFPPNKGDKVRSYQILRFLASRYRVYLATFVDDPADAVHVAHVERLCAGLKALPLRAKLSRLASLRGLLTGAPLTLTYFASAELRRWVSETVRQHGIERGFVFSSGMVQFVPDALWPKTVIDFVDVDSEKWTTYAATRPFPLSWLYRREGRRLLAVEREAAARARASAFVTRAEADLFISRAPECAGSTVVVENGVDSAFFSPDATVDSPYAEGEKAVVFTGAMDYWPNVDAVTWFTRECLPELRSRDPQVRFYIVGMNPTREVQQLTADPSVVVTGRVPDVRPYLRHAKVAVAPLRVARGVQNKVLEAMAMGLPVVTTRECAKGLSAVPGREIVLADGAEEWVDAVAALLQSPDAGQIGLAARQRVLADYDWGAHLGQLGKLLGSATPVVRPAAAGDSLLEPQSLRFDVRC